MPRSPAPFVDLTPLADVVWLLLVFFLFSGKFKAEERHPIDLPSSTFHGKVCGLANLITFRVEASGNIGVLVGSHLRQALADKMPVAGDHEESDGQFPDFAGGEFNFGFNRAGWMGDSLDLEGGNPLKWVDLLQSLGENFSVAIRADQNVPYPVVGGLLDALSSRKILRVSLVTNLEIDPVASI